MPKIDFSPPEFSDEQLAQMAIKMQKELIRALSSAVGVPERYWRKGDLRPSVNANGDAYRSWRARIVAERAWHEAQWDRVIQRWQDDHWTRQRRMRRAVLYLLNRLRIRRN